MPEHQSGGRKFEWFVRGHGHAAVWARESQRLKACIPEVTSTLKCIETKVCRRKTLEFFL